MDLKELKEKAITVLKTQKGTVQFVVPISGLQDENGKKYKFGQITLIEFINNLTDDKLYKLMETYNNNFIITSHKLIPQLNMFINPIHIDKILNQNIENQFIEAYPELKTKYLNMKQEINNSNCKNCSKNSKILQLLNELTYLDNKNRKNEFFKEIYGENFYNVLLTSIKRENKQINTTNTSQELSDGPRSSCPNCSMKHISNAIVLLNESKMGYPAHRWLAIGHLDQAAEEILRDYPIIANTIRNIRLELMENPDKIPLVMKLLENMDKKFNPTLYKE